ncbi:MAG: hypothetical protein ACUVXA_01550 [Candidatus Jordarchaeum sp.]|uniref:hypothetical protein n=1 Tax=Candidatus Jordarchaeum sp. TaxID=2823881 RepID=UPI00404B7963
MSSFVCFVCFYAGVYLFLPASCCSSDWSPGLRSVGLTNFGGMLRVLHDFSDVGATHLYTYLNLRI